MADVILFKKRLANVSAQCEQIRQRRRAMRYHRQVIKRDTLAICRRPLTLGAAFATGGILAYLFNPSGGKLHAEEGGIGKAPPSRGSVRAAAELALVKYLATVLFEQVPNYFLRRQAAGGSTAVAPQDA